MTTLNDTFTGGNEAEAAIDAEVRAMFDSIDPGTPSSDEDELILDRFLRLSGQFDDEMHRVANQAAAIMRKLKTRIDRLNYQMLPIIERIARAKLAGKRAKTLDRLWGKVGFRTIPANLAIDDEDAVRKAIIAGTLPDTCQRTRIELAKDAINDHYKATGELPPGCRIVEAHEKFWVG